MRSLFFLLTLLLSFTALAYNPYPPGAKTSWPEVMNMKGNEAKDMILKDCPDCNVIVMNEHSPMTRDLRPMRVRVPVNDEGFVTHVPYRG